MTVLRGKGVWVYLTEELDRALQIAPQMGATHILYKVGKGATYFSGVALAAQKIKDAGLIPFAWMCLLLDDPQGEAQVARQAFQDGFQGFIFDTEANRCRGRFGQASQLGQHIRDAGLDLNKLYNCSFPYISGHLSPSPYRPDDLPYDQMNEFCKGGLMPMSYGTYFSPESAVPHDEQVRTVIDEWTYGEYEKWCLRWGYRPPMYPVLGPYHDEPGHVRMPPDEFQLWLDRLAAHGPTFFSVYRAGVINDDLLPLIRAYPLGGVSTPVPTGIQVEVVSPEVGFLRVRPTPSTDQLPNAKVDHGAVIESLEPGQGTRAKVGRDGQWLHILTPGGVGGYVAAWYLRFPGEGEGGETTEATIQVEVVSPELGFLRVRPTSSIDQASIAQVNDGGVLESLEPEQDTRAKVGQRDQWLRVRTPQGVEGYVAAWYLRLYGEEEEAVVTGPVPHVVVHSGVGLNVRPGPGTDSDPIWHVVDRTVLEVREDSNKVGAKLGKDRWLKVRAPSLHEGYVNGLHVRAQQLADKRTPVDDSALSHGECAWIFGIHAADSPTADFRSLFGGKDKTGWILVTQEVRADPTHDRGHDYSSWSNNGYGVIVRLNYGYEPSGTLPVSAEYGDFAAACARYVQNSQGCHIWSIANEQNNPREHPGGPEHPAEHITPQRYAEAFNLARRRIKDVQPEAIVVPGAVDPYFGLAWKLTGERYRPLDYFKEMLSHIDDLDGIALHTYTHWLDVNLITEPTIFTDPFLQPGTPQEHYYDFLAYRPFAEAIPAKWRDRPIYITESNHWLALEHPPRNDAEARKAGWVNVDKGWVQAAYAEIDRWNNTPHAQQIHCLLLYRWTGDAWAIKNKGEIHKDFKKALDHNYRWRR